MLTILCVATYFKGDAFLRECHRLGCRVLLLTADSLADAGWPRDAIAEIATIPRTASEPDVRRAVAALARRHPIARVAALDDFDVELGAAIREFLQAPGFGRTVAGRFRDKLAMRTEARALGIAVPEFTAVFNDEVVAEWAGRVAPPWVLKPRSSAAATGIRKIASRDELQPALDAAGENRALCLLEQFVAGDVYHVDSIVRRGEIVFAVASKYGRPPFQIAHDGGVFTTRRLPDQSAEAAPLLDANRRLLRGFGLENGVSHTEFIAGGGPSRGATFLETSARVGGAYIADVIEAGTGINLWREWAKLEIAGHDGRYDAPEPRSDYGGIALCLSRQPEPDTSAYADAEIVHRIRKSHHAGLIVRSPDAERVRALLDDYVGRFSRDFLATMPAPERPAE
jgi:biotin carboxylase